MTVTLAKPFRVFWGRAPAGVASRRAWVGATNSCTTSAASISPAAMTTDVDHVTFRGRGDNLHLFFVLKTQGTGSS